MCRVRGGQKRDIELHLVPHAWRAGRWHRVLDDALGQGREAALGGAKKILEAIILAIGKVNGQGLNTTDPFELLPRFAYLRSLNLGQYESLTELEWKMTKSTTEGELSLEQLVRTHANHDLHHLKQLDRTLVAMTEG